jgi:hypothetical protein
LWFMTRYVHNVMRSKLSVSQRILTSVDILEKNE